MKSIDLHVHSTYSDGTLTPSELVKKAFSINLAAMALTDHDTIDGIPEAVSCAADYDIELPQVVQTAQKNRSMVE